MSLASHRRSWTVAAVALVLVALTVVNGCTQRSAQARARANAPAAVAPTTQPSDTAEATIDTADASAQPAEPATQTAGDVPTTQPTTAVADVTPTDAEPATHPATAAAVAARKPDAPNAALAERLAQNAQGPLRAQVVVESSWQTAAALLEAATRLQPNEPRFVRLLAEARSRSGDISGAIEALATYRRLAPGDQFAQVQQVDLYLTRMETADAKVKYLESLIASDAVAAEVRSHAAVRAAQTMFERSQPQQADSMLGKALELNPLNVEALRMRATASPDATAAQRVASILAIMRASPGDAATAAALARELSAAGLRRPAQEWYRTAMQLHLRSWKQAGAQFATEWVAALYLADELKEAEDLLTQVIAGDPLTLDAWTLRLVMARGSGDAKKYEDARRQAAATLVNRLAMIRQVTGDTTATTRPVDAPEPAEFPQPAQLLQRVVEANREDVFNLFVETSATVAWFKIYFEQKPTEAIPWIGVLKQVLGDQNPLVARMEGWSFLMVDRPDEAKVKLSAVAERDPLAALGMVKLAGPAGDAEARRLLERHRGGVLGALLHEALRDRKIEPEPAPDAAAIGAELDKFPKDFARTIEQPGLFYAARLEPLAGSHAFGEPILARVSIQNVGTDPLTIGQDGLIKPDLWIDAQMRGFAPQPFPGVAYDRIAGPLVLRPGQSTSQVVRIDQGNLNSFLEANPIPAFQLNATLTTNPIMTQQGLLPGLGGVRAAFPRLVARSGSPLNSEPARQRMLQTLNEGSPPEKVRMLGLVTTFAMGLSTEKADENSKAVAAQFKEWLRRAMNDPEPSVRAWARYLNVIVAAPADRGPIVQRMLEGDWMQRLFALMLVQSGAMPTDIAQRLARSDDDPLIRSYATAVLELIRTATTQPAATQPAGAATRPTTAPATAPVTSSDSRPAP